MPLLKDQSNLIVFAREPKLGQVKTRLQKSFSCQDTLVLYKSFLRDVLEIARSVSCDHRMIYYTGGNSKLPFLSKYRNQFEFRRQRGNDLGFRMLTAFQRSFNQGYKKTIIIGTDCLTISPKEIEFAFRQLSEYNCILGPARDGGYYLIGLNCFSANLFRGIQWGSSEVFAKTLKKAKKANLKVHMLKEKEDIDTVDSLRRVQKLLTQNKATADLVQKVLSR